MSDSSFFLIVSQKRHLNTCGTENDVTYLRLVVLSETNSNIINGLLQRDVVSVSITESSPFEPQLVNATLT